MMQLHKMEADYDPCDADTAIMTMRKRHAQGEVVTGLLYIDEDAQDLHDLINTSKRPLNSVPASELCPGSAKLAEINEGLK
jgi:2-oxoglutarate ferredoxin oxidoreductase subunit beta